MDSITSLMYVEGDLVLTMINLFVFVFSLDFVITFASLIKGIGDSVK